uniref:MFS domain-containing protein n=1 Tax=Syphacia muris TaxID=451379 RepID=A0A0N5AGV1_9BILA
MILPSNEGDGNLVRPPDDNDELCAETRSAPGDLALPVSSNDANNENSDAATSSSALPPFQISLGLPSNNTPTFRPMGHYRNVNNGFASGPPWPTPKREKSWATVRVWQKQQQIQAIEKEITVMANETLVGICKWRPPWMQRFSSLKWMIFWLCWYCAVQGLLVNGLVPSAITSIERRFQFTSSTIGRIMQFYDFGYVLFCIPVSYFGGRHSKPVVLAMGLLFLALGSFIFTLPHTISEPYTSSYHADDLTHSRCESGYFSKR